MEMIERNKADYKCQLLSLQTEGSDLIEFSEAHSYIRILGCLVLLPITFGSLYLTCIEFFDFYIKRVI